MKYKVGDKVRIKTWYRMEKEFGLTLTGSIDCPFGYLLEMERDLLDMKSDRVVTVEKAEVIGSKTYYRMKDFKNWDCSDDMIDRLHSDDDCGCLFDSIENRFELIDFEE